MKILQVSTIVIFIILVSCENKTNLPSIQNDFKVIDLAKSISADTVKKITIDDYSVTNKMLKESSQDLISGEIISTDKAWFFNDTLKQTLVFELYTDYHRFETYHFLNDDIPKDLINRMALNVKISESVLDTANRDQKQTYFKGFIGSGTEINKNYFTSTKGFRLGDKKEKAIEIYGKPDKISNDENFEEYEWRFVGDIIYEENPLPNSKPLAKNSFGYEVTMYFKNNKIVGIILFNDIP